MDKESACNAGDLGSVPGLGRSPGEGNDNPLQYACLGNQRSLAVFKAFVEFVTILLLFQILGFWL